MTMSFLEHVNVTVSNPDATAERLTRWFGWQVRWSGPAKDNGRTVHIGDKASYLALYANGSGNKSQETSYATLNGLNHIGIVVSDLDEAERRILADGYKTHNHGNYEPGRRFYFSDEDGIEFEVVSYAP